MEACAVICGKATVALPDANFLSPWCQSPSSRAQNRGFCALFAFGTPIFGHFEHKIGVFVRFCPSEPLFSGISSTKSGFLCAFCLRPPPFSGISSTKSAFFCQKRRYFPGFVPFRAQNRHFCALLLGTRPSATETRRSATGEWLISA